jgi:hypothetical protein
LLSAIHPSAKDAEVLVERVLAGDEPVSSE